MTENKIQLWKGFKGFCPIWAVSVFKNNKMIDYIFFPPSFVLWLMTSQFDVMNWKQLYKLPRILLQIILDGAYQLL